MHQSIDIACAPGAQQQTRRSGVLWANDETDRQPIKQGIAPGPARRYVPADGSPAVAYRFAANQAIGIYTYFKIAADLRPSADGSAVRTSLVAGGG